MGGRTLDCNKSGEIVHSELEVAKAEKLAIKQLNAILKVIGLNVVSSGKTRSATRGRTVYKYVLSDDSLKRVQTRVERRRQYSGWAWINQYYGWEPAHDDE
jgi:NAD(P)H-nitrite reductase large subunit